MCARADKVAALMGKCKGHCILNRLAVADSVLVHTVRVAPGTCVIRSIVFGKNFGDAQALMMFRIFAKWAFFICYQPSFVINMHKKPIGRYGCRSKVKAKALLGLLTQKKKKTGHPVCQSVCGSTGRFSTHFRNRTLVSAWH